ncbi:MULTISPECIES: hypothetical protein [Nostoc]|uniref:Uncharacterized protein n=1 Tax=Nostoc paludosum FACHB-159 TaxID=2692908 RepID=A0ABR8K2J6_9NOSO|nr:MULTISPECIES: hypothetical protein [Nostoc]MBD2677207.1 hypothetical protein [Nostoc sp. FACHB-857]MBD2732984.1 hypothetical protein [Nostoc paludosum FACHB-159]
MPETLVGTSLSYYLIAFDANGKERENNGELISQKVVDILSQSRQSGQPITDVFLMSHGWQGDIPAAKDQYDRWIAAMAKNQADIQKMQQLRPGFRPLLIGLHWPSKPWGDENLNAISPDKTVVSFDVTDNSQEELINQYSQSIADTEAAREALRTIFTAAAEYEVAPDTLPTEVRAAYEVLIKEASSSSEGEDADGWGESESLNLDPDSVYEASLAQEDEDVSFGIETSVKSAADAFLNVPRLLSFWKMKDRARKIGQTSGLNLLNRLQQVTDNTVRFHLMGHSFGCILVSATVAGTKNNKLLRPVNSLALIQGAFSLWGFCANVPYRNNVAGYFRSIITDNKVAGPIVTTQSVYDKAVKNAYPMAGTLGILGGQDIDFGVDTSIYPGVGAIGCYGIQGDGLNISTEITYMQPVDKPYKFEPGKIYNLNSNDYIYVPPSLLDQFVGAHNAIDKPEVAHAVWSAAFGN